MSILTLHAPHTRSCPAWCQDHELLTVQGDDLLETYAASVGYVVPTDERHAIVEVRLALYRPMLDATRAQPPARVELRHEGRDIALGVTDARVLAELLLTAADALEHT